MVYIYSLSDPRTKEVRYVGKTHCPVTRLKGHVLDGRRKPLTHKRSWIISLQKLGFEPIIRILEEFENDEPGRWQAAERRWIRKFRRAGYRLTNSDSGGLAGKRISVESRAKMSAKKLGKKRAPHSLVTRAKMRAAAIGRKPSAETRERLSLSHKGIRPTPETLAKRGRAISKAQLGKRRPPCSEQARLNMSVAAKKAWHKRKEKYE